MAILISVVVLGSVFIRRFLLFKRGGGNKKSLKNKSVVDEENGNDGGGGSDGGGDGKISKEDRAKVEALCNRGETLVKAGKDDEAIKCFVQALAVYGAHNETLNKLAMLYLQKQMFSAAAALFKQLGELTQDAVHFSHLGLALYQQSDFEGAKEAYQKAVDLDSSRPQRFISLAQVYRSLGQPYNALVAVSKAVELDPENEEFKDLMKEIKKLET